MKLTVPDASRLLSVPEERVHEWIDAGEIPAHRLNERWWLSRAELLEWATAKGLPVSPDLFAGDDDSAPLPAIASALARGGVLRRVPGRTPEATLRAVVAALPFPPGVDREFLLSVLLSREALGSTAIGEGIAIPHVRNPIVLHVGQPLVSIAFLEEPVDFRAPDGLPVRVLFTLVTPTVRAHLHLLSRLAWLLRDSRFREAVKSEADRDTLLAVAGHVEAGLK